jgi:hypothetical protein
MCGVGVRDSERAPSSCIVAAPESDRRTHGEPSPFVGTSYNGGSWMRARSLHSARIRIRSSSSQPTVSSTRSMTFLPGRGPSLIAPSCPRVLFFTHSSCCCERRVSCAVSTTGAIRYGEERRRIQKAKFMKTKPHGRTDRAQQVGDGIIAHIRILLHRPSSPRLGAERRDREE